MKSPLSIVFMASTVGITLSLMLMMLTEKSEPNYNFTTPDSLVRVGDTVSVGPYTGVLIRRIDERHWSVLTGECEHPREITVDWIIIRKVSNKETNTQETK